LRLLRPVRAEDLQEGAHVTAVEVVHQVKAEETIRIDEKGLAAGRRLRRVDSITPVEPSQGVRHNGDPKAAELIDPSFMQRVLPSADGEEGDAFPVKGVHMAIQKHSFEQLQPVDETQDDPPGSALGQIHVGELPVDQGGQAKGGDR
jgi:hypothetical protein